MNKRKSIILLIDVIFLAILIFLDQITKYFAIVYLKGQESLKVVDGVFEFNYLENRGAAFGMLQDQKFFFVFIAVVILAVIAYVLFKTPNQKKYTKLHIALVFIAAGAIGNMIDRLALNYVIDFFYFKLIDFPIFNVADIYVTCATFALAFLIIFYYKEDEIDAIFHIFKKRM